MATLQNSVQNSQSYDDPSSFQEVFTTCYSHGLESIYKLETIDLKSIRKLSEKKSHAKECLASSPEWQEEQRTFDLGSFYQTWITPTVLLEPIQVLQLSKPVEKNLIGLGFKHLKELRQVDLQGLKLGQGHIEDIRKRLQDYLIGKPLEKTDSIDFLSIVKCVFADLDPCKAYVLLEAYNLHEWIALTPSEAMEIKRSSLQEKARWLSGLNETTHQEKLSACILPIIEGFVKQWVHARGGVATRDELNEYLILRSTDELQAKKALELFKNYGDIYSSLFDLGSCLSFSQESAESFLLIEKIARSYFNHAGTYFLLDELLQLIVKEIALKWHFISFSFVGKVLRSSPLFRTYRQNNGKWAVQEAIT